MFDNSGNPDGDSVVDDSDDETGAAFLLRILQYLETPQYLRKALFPMHNSLRFVVWIIFLEQAINCILLKFVCLVELLGPCLTLVVCIVICRGCCHPLMLHTICANMNGVRIGKVRLTFAFYLNF